MRINRFVACALWIGTTVLAATVACGQEFPGKPIRIYTSEAGGGNDVVSRLIAQGIAPPLGQPVIVENRGIVGYELVAKAPPDGYTLLIQGAPFWVGPLLQKTPYDPVADFSPITLAIRQPNEVVVNIHLPVKSIRELIALARARPGELNYAAVSIGSSSHLAAELFKSMAGVKVVGIVYKNNALAFADVMAGQVQLFFVSAASVAPYVKSARLRALAVASAAPSPLAPGLPTVSASGLPGFESVSMAGVFAPARTPAATVERLRMEIVQVLNRQEVKERLFNIGVETVGSSPEELATTVKSEMAKLGKVIRDAGIRVE